MIYIVGKYQGTKAVYLKDTLTNGSEFIDKTITTVAR